MVGGGWSGWVWLGGRLGMLKIYLFFVKMPQCCVQISMLILPFSSIFFFYYSREEGIGWDGKGRDVMGRDGMGRDGMGREGKGWHGKGRDK